MGVGDEWQAPAPLSLAKSSSPFVPGQEPRPLCPWPRAPVRIVEEVGWAAVSVWTGVEEGMSLALTGVWVPNRKVL